MSIFHKLVIAATFATATNAAVAATPTNLNNVDVTANPQAINNTKVDATGGSIASGAINNNAVFKSGPQVNAPGMGVANPNGCQKSKAAYSIGVGAYGGGVSAGYSGGSEFDQKCDQAHVENLIIGIGLGSNDPAKITAALFVAAEKSGIVKSAINCITGDENCQNPEQTKKLMNLFGKNAQPVTETVVNPPKDAEPTQKITLVVEHKSGTAAPQACIPEIKSGNKKAKRKAKTYCDFSPR